ncbi:hypothetical protein Aduo_009000 [Ancylostoma duodenale]
MRQFPVVVTCFAEGHGYKRALLLTALDAGYLTKEYLYIMADPNSNGFYAPLAGGSTRALWIDPNSPGDGRDEEAKNAFMKIFLVSIKESGVREGPYRNFSKEVVSRMKDPPFLCTTECEGDRFAAASQYAPQLHDAFYAYARALNSTLSLDPNAVGNGTALLRNIKMEFEGASGNVVITENGTRCPTFYINALNEKDEDIPIGSIFVNGNRTDYTALYKSEEDIWFTRGGARPVAVPKCGFEGKECPPDFVSTYLVWIIVGGLILMICVLCCVAGIVFSIL